MRFRDFLTSENFLLDLLADPAFQLPAVAAISTAAAAVMSKIGSIKERDRTMSRRFHNELIAFLGVKERFGIDDERTISMAKDLVDTYPDFAVLVRGQMKRPPLPDAEHQAT